MPGQVYAVASGKGGVGKTTTVVNLGVALRRHDHSVALVDADLGMANLAALLGLDHEPTLHDVLAGEVPLEDALVEEADGFVVVPGTRELSGFAAANPTRLGGVLEELAERYEYVLVDTGAGVSYEDILPLGLVDGVILVSSPDPAAVGDTAKTLELTDVVGGSVRGIVVTYADDEAAESTAEELGVDLLVAVPDDDAVPASAAVRKPLEAHSPDSPAAAAYRELADVVLATEDERDEDDDGEASGDEGKGEPAAADGADGEADEETADENGDERQVPADGGRETEDERGDAGEDADEDADENGEEEESDAGDENGGEEEGEDADSSGGFLSRLFGVFR